MPLVLAVLVLTFILIHLAPGDPIYILAGDGGDKAYYTEMRAYYGLDRPLPEQLVRYLLAVIHGDFGYSFTYQQPVLQVILGRIPATLLLMGTALALSTILGLLLGTLTGSRPHTKLDRVITALTLTVYGIPVFWLGQLLIIVFAIGLNWFPIEGMVSARDDYTGILRGLDVLHHLALPAISLTLSLLTGAALTETVFAWPGLGRLLLSATLNRDYPLLMAIFILVAVTVIIANLFTDLLYTWLDPRVRYK